jgi:hypothetical protein
MMSIPDFEAIKQINIYGVEYWRARDLMPLLGYGKKWQNFETVIKKAMVACSETGNIIEQHFTDASKTSPMPETLPPAASIRKMVEERRKASKRRKLKAESQNQDKLFQD